MKIRNISPLGEVHMPTLGHIAKPGEVIDVPAKAARELITQGHFAAASKPSTRKPAEKATTPKGTR